MLMYVEFLDGKQHLSGVVFSALIRFSLLEKYPTFDLLSLGNNQKSQGATSGE